MQIAAFHPGNIIKCGACSVERYTIFRKINVLHGFKQNKNHNSVSFCLLLRIGGNNPVLLHGFLPRACTCISCFCYVQKLQR